MNSLTYAENALLDLLETKGLPQGALGALVAGNRSGTLPVAIALKYPDVKLAVHVFDAFHARTLRDRMNAAGVSPVGRLFNTPYVPEGTYGVAFFQTTPRSMPGELVLDQLEDIYSRLADGATLYAGMEGDPDENFKMLKKVFPKVGPLPLGKPMQKFKKHVALFRCVKQGELGKRRDFASVWEASVPGGKTLKFTSLPGCFCHRRVDIGGLALAEVASKEVKAGDAVLDMGCGCGLVGLLVADAQRRLFGNAGALTLIDSHARAIEAARTNAANFGLGDVRFILSDDGLPRGEKESCDLFVGNPPYYSEYKIAETFLSTAYRALKKGGICLTVVKTATGLKALQEQFFSRVEVISRRGYAVLKSIR